LYFIHIRPLVVLLLLCIVSGCSVLPVNKVTTEYLHSDKTYILNVPFIKQKSKSCCGLVCLSMVLKYWTEDTESTEFAQQGLCPKGGFSGDELRQMAEKQGFRAVIYKGNVADLYQHLEATRLIIVFLGKQNSRHSFIVCGRTQSEEIVLVDPAEGYVFAKIQDFQKAWKRSNFFSMLVIPTV